MVGDRTAGAAAAASLEAVGAAVAAGGGDGGAASSQAALTSTPCPTARVERMTASAPSSARTWRSASRMSVPRNCLIFIDDLPTFPIQLKSTSHRCNEPYAPVVGNLVPREH